MGYNQDNLNKGDEKAGIFQWLSFQRARAVG
jgi:hypothetical protein